MSVEGEVSVGGPFERGEHVASPSHELMQPEGEEWASISVEGSVGE